MSSKNIARRLQNREITGTIPDHQEKLQQEKLQQEINNLKQKIEVPTDNRRLGTTSEQNLEYLRQNPNPVFEARLQRNENVYQIYRRALESRQERLTGLTRVNTQPYR